MTSQAGKVFISHASKDKPFVDRLVADFAEQQIPVWYDKLDIKIGDSVPGKINAGISEAKYFLVVLSPASVSSKWVLEELNAALMIQIASSGTFLMPLLLEDCDIPPLLSHRRHADFRHNYQAGLQELLATWGKDASAAKQIGDKPLFPWPDLEVSDHSFVYLHSTRFDKFFRMNCELTWTANYTIDYITSTLELPWNKELPQLGMRWSFIYGLVYKEKSVPLSKRLNEADIVLGSTIQINISGRYEDLYDKELKEMWDGTKMYEMSGVIRRQAELQEAKAARGPLTRERLRQISDSCFSHV